jgi:hypothetical protein
MFSYNLIRITYIRSIRSGSSPTVRAESWGLRAREYSNVRLADPVDQRSWYDLINVWSGSRASVSFLNWPPILFRIGRDLPSMAVARSPMFY